MGPNRPEIPDTNTTLPPVYDISSSPTSNRSSSNTTPGPSGESSLSSSSSSSSSSPPSHLLESFFPPTAPLHLPIITALSNSPDLALIASCHCARFSLSSCEEREHVGSVSKRCVTGRAKGGQRQRRPASDEPPSLSRELKSFGSEPKCAEPQSTLISGISFHFKGWRNLA